MDALTNSSDLHEDFKSPQKRKEKKKSENIKKHSHTLKKCSFFFFC